MLAIATNIAVLLMTASVLQGHIFSCNIITMDFVAKLLQDEKANLYCFHINVFILNILHKHSRSNSIALFMYSYCFIDYKSNA